MSRNTTDTEDQLAVNLTVLWYWFRLDRNLSIVFVHHGSKQQRYCQCTLTTTWVSHIVSKGYSVLYSLPMNTTQTSVNKVTQFYINSQFPIFCTVHLKKACWLKHCVSCIPASAFSAVQSIKFVCLPVCHAGVICGLALVDI